MLLVLVSGPIALLCEVSSIRMSLINSEAMRMCREFPALEVHDDGKYASILRREGGLLDMSQGLNSKYKITQVERHKQETRYISDRNLRRNGPAIYNDGWVVRKGF